MASVIPGLSGGYGADVDWNYTETFAKEGAGAIYRKDLAVLSDSREGLRRPTLFNFWVGENTIEVIDMEATGGADIGTDLELSDY